MKRDDSGFTLVELLLSMAIIVIIVGSLSAALIVFLTNGTEALERDDHSGGSAVAVSYFDRDVASADSVTTGGTTCSGSTNLALLTWTEYVASATAPSPVPGSTEYRVAYTVVTDPTSVPVGGGTRYRLQRVLCQGGLEISRTNLVGNLVSSSTSATAAKSADSTCSSNEALTMTVAVYSNDSTSGNSPYRFRACTRTRLTP